jgi:alkylation response protein AidB-like acyl-CoA dehydrogenase
MDFTIGDEERALRDGLAAVLGGTRGRRGDAPEPDLLRDVAAGGWLGLALPDPEDPQRSIGFRLAYLCEEIGAQLYPAPLSLLTALVIPFLATAPEAQTLPTPRVAIDGEAIATIVLPDGGAPFASRWTEVSIVSEEAGRAHVRGVAHGVIGAEYADCILLPLERPDGTLSVATLSPGDEIVRATYDDTLDLTRRSRAVEIDGWLDERSFIGGREHDHRAALERLVAAYCLALDAESVGAASALLKRTVDFTGNRRQFGVPVGSFQAIKHQLADCFARIELTRSMLYRIAAELDARQEQSGQDIAYSRMATADMYRLVAERCIQCHGAVGVTWEEGLHVFYRQALLYAQHPFPRSDLRDAVWYEPVALVAAGQYE